MLNTHAQTNGYNIQDSHECSLNIVFVKHITKNLETRVNYTP